MRHLKILILLLFLRPDCTMSQDKVPYEPKENFGFELDYTFKTRSAPSIDKVSFVESNAPRGSQVLPYLKIKFDFSDFEIRYYRLKVYNNVGIVIKNRKIKRPVSYTLDMGFSDDLKDRVTSHKYSIYFYEKSKQPISKIDIEVAENGDLFLNGEFHGRI